MTNANGPNAATPPDSIRTPPGRPPRELLTVFVPAFLFVLAAFGITWHFVQPAPPSHVVIATGPKSGAYYAIAQKYVDYFGANGVELEVRETGGTVDNFKLLGQPDSGVDIAVVQAGASPPPEQRPGIQAVAGIYYEPVLVFYRGDTPVTRVPQLAGKKIAIGAEGSGVRVMAQMLLDEAGVSTKTDGATFQDIGGDEAAAALASGTIDAAFYVIAPDAPVVARLLAMPGVHLMGFDNARAYGRLHPFLSPTTLYRGSVDIRQDLPASDIPLIAAPTTLAIRSDTHPAIIQLLVRAAQETNRGSTLLSDPGVFPMATGSELPTNHDALYFLQNAPNVLHRTLPFWLAAMIDRLIILVLPLLVVLIPLFRATPPLLKWRTERKLLARYRRVRQIEDKLSMNSPRLALQAGVEELNAIDEDLMRIKIPASFSKDLFDLRGSVEYVSARLEKWLAAKAE